LQATSKSSVRFLHRWIYMFFTSLQCLKLLGSLFSHFSKNRKTTFKFLNSISHGWKWLFQNILTLILTFEISTTYIDFKPYTLQTKRIKVTEIDNFKLLCITWGWLFNIRRHQLILTLENRLYKVVQISNRTKFETFLILFF
jgi:hypothetical protein